MASVSKLSIRGVRSFSPEDAEQVVEFYFPCTIIVGANGCGKTTIIESLKYAVCGAFPPGNRSGQAFVHDPRSIGLNQVKANVKLRFTGRNGNSMVVVRSMELTQKKKSVTFKQLDGVVRTTNPETGERVSLSHKCSELDKTIPQYMGVSRAVLEHVIFCHQEDASWPLMEGAVLKKRFDEIFDSTRYTKALEVFKKTEKDFLSQVKELRTDLASLASFKHSAEGFRRDLGEQNEQIEVLDDEKKDINASLAETEKDINEISGTIEEVEEIAASIETQNIELDRHNAVIKARRKMLEDDMTDRYNVRQLQDMVTDFDAKMSSEKTEKKRLEAEYKEVGDRIESLGEEGMKLNSRMGKFTAEQEAHAARLRERCNKMENIQQSYSIDFQATATQMGASLCASMTASQTVVSGTQDGTVNFAPEDINYFFSILDKKEEEIKGELKSKRQRLQKQEDELQAKLTEFGGKLKAVESEIARLDERSNEAKRELHEVSRDITTGGHSKIRQADVEEARKRAAHLSTQLDEANSDPRGNEIKLEIRHNDDKIDKLKRLIDDDKMALSTLRLSADSQNTIDVLKTQCMKDLEGLDESMRELSSVLQKHNLQVANALPGTDSDEDGAALVTSVNGLTGSIKERYDTAETELSRVSDALSRVLQTISDKSAVLVSRQQALSSLKSKMEGLSGNNGPLVQVGEVSDAIRQREPGAVVVETRDMLNYLDAKLKRLEEDAPGAFSLDAAKQVLKKLRKMCRVPSNGPDGYDIACPCCRRDMSVAESATFEKSVIELLDESNPSSLVTVDPLASDKYRREKATYSKWRQVVSDNADAVRDFRRMTAERTDLEHDIDRQQDALTTQQAKVNDLKEEVAEFQPAVDELQEVVDAAKRWSADANRIADKRIEVQQKQSELSATSSLAGRDLRTVEREMGDRVDEKDALTSKINKLTKDATALNNNISQLSVQATRMSKIARDKEDKFAVEQKATIRKTELLKLQDGYAGERKTMSEQITPLKQKIRAKEQEKAKVRSLSAEEEGILNTAITSFCGDKQNLLDLTKCIDDYAGSSKAQALDQAKADTVKLQDRTKEQKAILKRLQPDVTRIRNAVDHQERHKKQLNQNIELLQSKKRVDELKEEIARLETDLGNVEGRDTCYARQTEATDRKEQQQASKARTEGRWSEIVEQIRSLNRKLVAEEYNDVDERHRVCTIKVETTRIAAEDLKKYYTALDKALHQFHSVKLAEINKIIRELWLLTYKGEDIDNIELESGQESGSRAAKSYNYRVVMTKGSTKLDMRGRCSAGQRVLACTVIRFALAETFGVNCGCIALDEPTVNLDFRNKRGLAIALAQIISSRAQQRNFQLILITHDEEFVSLMKTELSTQTGFSMPDKYFQVRREQAADGKFYSKIDAIDWDELV